MLPISDSVKKELAFINQTVGKGDIWQALKIAKETKDVITPPTSESAQKKISEVFFTRRSLLDKVNPTRVIQVTAIMRKNPYDESKCSAKEEYLFQWDDSENTWKLESLTETD